MREMAYVAGSFTVLACGPCGESYRLNSTPRFASSRHQGDEIQLVLRLENDVPSRHDDDRRPPERGLADTG
jgi:hypothetical protein